MLPATWDVNQIEAGQLIIELSAHGAGNLIWKSFARS
jgi:hypothetical protein